MANMEHLSLVPPLSEATFEERETNEAPSSPINLVECSPSDEELQEFIDQPENQWALRQGDININMISKLDRPYGWAYKIMKAKEDATDDAELVGVAYAVRKGMDVGAIQIAYMIAPEHQRKGYAAEAVGQLTEQLNSSYDIVALISPENHASMKVVEGLGYQALNATNQETSYVKLRTRRSVPRSSSIA